MSTLMLSLSHLPITDDGAVEVMATTVNSNLDTPAITESSWADTFSTEEVRKSQDTDPDITKIIGWMEALLDRPARSDRAMKLASIGLLRLWGQWKRLELVHGRARNNSRTSDNFRPFTVSFRMFYTHPDKVSMHFFAKYKKEKARQSFVS